MIDAGFLGDLIKALDTDLAASTAALAVLYAVALGRGWSASNFYTRVMMYGVVLLSSALALFSGNLSYSFYFEGADPFHSVAHVWVRVVYLVAGALASDILLSIPLGVVVNPDGVLTRRGWWRALAAVALLNVLSMALLVGLDLAGLF